jgi:hypothetical protein
MVQKIFEKQKELICVVGGKGNMGRRYCCILDFLGVPYYVVDLDTDTSVHLNTTGFILATPTNTHSALIMQYAKEWQLPILCEKPICKDPKELSEILKIKTPLRMINQYAYYFLHSKNALKRIEMCAPEYMKGATYYNYYNSGSDGKYWDHINIIGLNSDDDINIRYDSPVWDCWINGKFIEKQRMDEAYIWDIEDWIEKKNDTKKYIKFAHEKVWALLKDEVAQ